MKRIFVFILALTLVFTLTACSKEYTNISNEELTVMLESPDDYQFIDVRTLIEYSAEHVPGFTENLDYYLFENNYSYLDGLDKDIPVVIMCNSGNRSVSAAKIFIELGFKEVYNLEDGIEGWDGPTE